MDDIRQESPSEGQILNLKKRLKNSMAFKVLKKLNCVVFLEVKLLVENFVWSEKLSTCQKLNIS